MYIPEIASKKYFTVPKLKTSEQYNYETQLIARLDSVVIQIVLTAMYRTAAIPRKVLYFNLISFGNLQRKTSMI